jgi:NAD(P) transhydrogenase subunit beta
MREINLEDVATQLAYARQVVFVPGYGMATAQAQHVVRELGETLEERGVTVKYAIHPVAGRMPGHMNVLLAEADVPYSQLYELEQINPDFPNTDVAVVIGANDVVNPDARDNPKSPIAGMPILDVDRARSVIVLKRGKGAVSPESRTRSFSCRIPGCSTATPRPRSDGSCKPSRKRE